MLPRRNKVTLGVFGVTSVAVLIRELYKILREEIVDINRKIYFPTLAIDIDIANEISSMTKTRQEYQMIMLEYASLISDVKAASSMKEFKSAGKALKRFECRYTKY